MCWSIICHNIFGENLEFIIFTVKKRIICSCKGLGRGGGKDEQLEQTGFLGQ